MRWILAAGLLSSLAQCASSGSSGRIADDRQSVSSLSVSADGEDYSFLVTRDEQSMVGGSIRRGVLQARALGFSPSSVDGYLEAEANIGGGNYTVYKNIAPSPGGEWYVSCNVSFSGPAAPCLAYGSFPPNLMQFWLTRSDLGTAPQAVRALLKDARFWR
ncbi:hypothetical protein ACFWZ4_12275 [Frateuria sp. GZRe12]|uniref:hypothetical protein n=1 Tax=Frateuria sp. GZRe12 TaxID=3351533 RepID=UPI003EDBF84A